MAMRRKRVQAEIARYVVEFRKREAQAVARYLEQQGIEATMPPMVLAMIFKNVSHALAAERAIGVSESHGDMKALFEGWLRDLEEGGELFLRAPKERPQRTRTRRKAV